MSTAAERLRAMHAGLRPLILPNVWDAVSAQAFADAGFEALATSSSAVAASLGHRDGQTPRDEMFAAVARIARSVSVPVTADIENGYGLSPAQLARTLADCGVVGCNLEDSDPVSRTLTDPTEQAEFLAAVRAAAGRDLVINARVDVYVRPAGPQRSEAADGSPAAGPDPTDAAVARARAYLAAGADCAYPILAPPAALPELVRRIDGPVNAMYRPGGPTIAELAAMGVQRISFGGGLHTRAAGTLREMAAALAGEARAGTGAGEAGQAADAAATASRARGTHAG